jgi:hypothetical protein
MKPDAFSNSGADGKRRPPIAMGIPRQELKITADSCAVLSGAF